jgi:hypothetical protein
MLCDKLIYYDEADDEPNYNILNNEVCPDCGHTEGSVHPIFYGSIMCNECRSVYYITDHPARHIARIVKRDTSVIRGNKYRTMTFIEYTYKLKSLNNRSMYGTRRNG